MVLVLTASNGLVAGSGSSAARTIRRLEVILLFSPTDGTMGLPVTNRAQVHRFEQSINYRWGKFLDGSDP